MKKKPLPFDFYDEKWANREILKSTASLSLRIFPVLFLVIAGALVPLLFIIEWEGFAAASLTVRRIILGLWILWAVAVVVVGGWCVTHLMGGIVKTDGERFRKAYRILYPWFPWS